MAHRKPANRGRPSNSNSKPTSSEVDEDEAPPPAVPSHFEPYPANKTHRLLESGPVVLVSTSYNDLANLMTLGFHGCVQHDGPPLISVSIGPWDHSYEALRETGECVIAVPGVNLAEKVVDIGNCSGEDVDKWEKFGFTPLPAQEIDAPLVSECLACIECTVHDDSMVDKYNLWILEPVQAWINNTREEKRTMHHKGDGTFLISGELLDLKSRMTKWKDLQD